MAKVHNQTTHITGSFPNQDEAFEHMLREATGFLDHYGLSMDDVSIQTNVTMHSPQFRCAISISYHAEERKHWPPLTNPHLKTPGA